MNLESHSSDEEKNERYLEKLSVLEFFSKNDEFLKKIHKQEINWISLGFEIDEEFYNRIMKEIDKNG